MLSVAVVVSAALLWLGLLFGTALYAERNPRVLAGQWRYVYALSLAVYCTSWTFFGTVTQAARYDWPLPPTFVGTLLLYAFAAMAMQRLVRLAHASNATSIADLIATRLGKDAWLAATVTLVAALGLIPYIALQLKAVAMSYALLTSGDEQAAPTVAGQRVVRGAGDGGVRDAVRHPPRQRRRAQPRAGAGDGVRGAVQAGGDARTRLVRVARH